MNEIPKLIDPENQIYSASAEVVAVCDINNAAETVEVDFELMPHDPSVFKLASFPVGRIICTLNVDGRVFDEGMIDKINEREKERELSSRVNSAAYIASTGPGWAGVSTAVGAMWPANLGSGREGCDEAGRLLGSVLRELVRLLPEDVVNELEKERLDRIDGYSYTFNRK